MYVYAAINQRKNWFIGGRRIRRIGFMKITLPDNVEMIIDTLTKAGYEAYAVGGCVRDSILGKNPKDWDITTSAFPNEIKVLFPRTIDTGILHGTVTVMVGKEGYEITTYRIDGEYEDARHPKEVLFTSNLKLDLERRDFTINAMAYNHQDGLVDLFNGEEDLENGRLRCVGDAQMRFQEDALRMMRAIRFSAQLNFSMDQSVNNAILSLAENLKKVSSERIQAELMKILESDYPERITELYHTRLLIQFWPELAQQMDQPFELDAIIAQLKILKQPQLRLALLFLGKTGGKEDANRSEKILRRMKFDNETIRKVKQLSYWHLVRPELEASYFRKMMCEGGADLFPDYFFIQEAKVQVLDEKNALCLKSWIQGARIIWEEILNNQDCYSIRQLAITGEDVIALGIKQGKQVGEVLNFLLQQVMKDPSKNEKEYLCHQVKEFME